LKEYFPYSFFFPSFFLGPQFVDVVRLVRGQRIMFQTYSVDEFCSVAAPEACKAPGPVPTTTVVAVGAATAVAVVVIVIVAAPVAKLHSNYPVICLSSLIK
jgi:hypothetical protein